MKKKALDVLVLGGGLTGLAIAYYLRNSDFTIKILEGRQRLGGRICTLYNDGKPPIEMGATWLGSNHTALTEILKELNIEIFEQALGEQAIYEPISTSPPQLVTLPPNNEPSFRIVGGSSKLIQVLESHLSKDQIYIGQQVGSIHFDSNGFKVKCQKSEHHSDIVISTLPPNLLVSSLEMSPDLNGEMTELAQNTHTWMGESIKVSLSFAKPFWQDENTSGTIFSSVGPIQEMYDHSDYENKLFALMGFMNSSYYSVSKEERINLILKQLQKYFGPKVDEFIAYDEMLWIKEPLTFGHYDAHILPHQNNGHPLFKEALLNGNFYIAGSETADQFPGYMEGAIRSAKFVSQQLLKRSRNMDEIG